MWSTQSDCALAELTAQVWHCHHQWWDDFYRELPCCLQVPARDRDKLNLEPNVFEVLAYVNPSIHSTVGRHCFNFLWVDRTIIYEPPPSECSTLLAWLSFILHWPFYSLSCPCLWVSPGMGDYGSCLTREAGLVPVTLRGNGTVTRGRIIIDLSSSAYLSWRQPVKERPWSHILRGKFLK